MPDAPLPAGSALAHPAFGERRNARLKELIGSHAEEIGDGVEICQLDLPLALQELAQRGGVDIGRSRQRFLLLLADEEERFDVLAQLVNGSE